VHRRVIILLKLLQRAARGLLAGQAGMLLQSAR
jgi:hypothetical protein